MGNNLKTSYVIVITILILCTALKCLQYVSIQYGIFSIKTEGKIYPSQLPRTSFNNNNKVVKQENNSKMLKSGLCKKGFFKVKEMTSCRKWFKCGEISRIKKAVHPMGGGIGKQVFSVNWTNSINFALVETRTKLLNHDWTTSRVKLGATNVISLQPSIHVIQVVGYCENGNKTTLLTESCAKYKDFKKFMRKRDFLTSTSLEVFNLAIQVVEAFVFLHYESGPPKVHCDLHTAKQALEQFLVTDDKRIVLNDVDELPTDQPIKGNIAKCWAEPNCKMSDASFLAPEQRYTVAQCKKKNSKIEASIKSDVWKIPDITREIFTGGRLKTKIATEVKGILKLLTPIHKNCKHKLPQDRWTSQQVLARYKEVYNRLM